MSNKHKTKKTPEEKRLNRAFVGSLGGILIPLLLIPLGFCTSRIGVEDKRSAMFVLISFGVPILLIASVFWLSGAIGILQVLVSHKELYGHQRFHMSCFLAFVPLILIVAIYLSQ